MLKPFTLSPGLFATLAAGHGGAPAIHELRSLRLSRTLLLLTFIIDSCASARPVLRDWLATVAEAQRRDPRSCGLLSDPMVGAWAAQTARAIQRGSGPLDAHLAHLGAIAATAAHRAGVEASVTPAARDGWVVFPTAGRVSTSAVSGDSITLATAEAHPAWQPLRRLHPGCGVVLNDIDPYRGGHHVPAADRLSPAAVDGWREVFASAWDLLQRRLPARAAEISAGLRCLVPLEPDSPHAAQSATVGDAYGAFGATTPASPVAFAVDMVHEFQHNKLDALLTLHRLAVPGHTGRYFAPWRTDPRPVSGLLHGVYAFLGVADAWNGLRAEPSVEITATAEFAATRARVDVALRSVQASGALTPAGERFAAGMRRSLDGLLAVPLPAAVVRRAHRALDDTHRTWQRRNG
ncbi:uncharacterized protein J2S43_001341 [Catenuloplanes nepalensis]|uniref:HEXXH motif domain-containing protein n=1 Tax=Catenuloplanes nepalensis TaxID=587533 RepID=A0ABT9MN63_9ACTN|nr:HEXXH motif-containing putative peptide modification protein [Catenuloplanes nepalensis]MDP9792829.1 uncharacterized protein [Catenuloplanes nepalensis]